MCDRPELPKIEITPAMIAAGSAELVFDTELIASDVVADILFAALKGGDFNPVFSSDVF